MLGGKFLDKVFYNMKYFNSLCVLLASLIVASCGSDVPPESRHMIGADISNFEVTKIGGGKVKLSSFKNGKPVVVNVWATWCSPCVKEMPGLLALQKSGQSQVVTISIDNNLATVKRFLKHHKLNGLNVVFDPNGINTRQKLAARKLPITYITDENLIVKKIKAGAREWDSEAMAKMVKGARSSRR